MAFEVCLIDVTVRVDFAFGVEASGVTTHEAALVRVDETEHAQVMLPLNPFSAVTLTTALAEEVAVTDKVELTDDN